jgi:PPP family 3-phenylpropionic acid transporter
MTAPFESRGSATLRVTYLAVGVWTASIPPFVAVILRAKGLDPATIGILSAVASLAATGLVPAWGHLADVVVGRATSFRIAIVVAVVGSVALLLPLPIVATAPILASFAIGPALFIGLGDALAVGGLEEPERQYGRLRALASLSFSAGVIGAGFVYDAAGYAAVPLVSIASCAVLFVLLGRVQDPTRDPAVRASAATHGGDELAGRLGSISRAIAIEPRFVGFLAVLTLAYTGVMGAMLFVGIRIVELGGQPSDVALSYGVSALFEVPGLVLVGWLGARIGLRWVVVLACIAYGLTIAGWGLLPAPLAINATRILTGVCFGALLGARVLVVARLLPGELQATGQTLVQGATFGLGNALGALIGGVVYGLLGPTAFFAIAGAMAIAGGIGSWIVLRGPVGAPSRVTTAATLPAHGAASLVPDPAVAGREHGDRHA